MREDRQNRTVKALLKRHGQTFAEELGIDARANTPAPLFGLLLLALLSSTRISSEIALKTSRVVLSRGWTTPRKIAASTWKQRVSAMGEGGYVRYDEKTSTTLGQVADMLLERYKGDLRNLREEAGRDPGQERELLKQIKGIGDVGADIFFREAQLAWMELYPFVDRRARAGARKLGLPTDPEKLEALVRNRSELVRLVAALVRAQLEGSIDEIKAGARAA